MFERIRNWLIRKLGGVPRDTYEKAVEIANRHQHGLLKLQQEQRRIIPVFARVDTYRLQGGYPRLYRKRVSTIDI